MIDNEIILRENTRIIRFRSLNDADQQRERAICELLPEPTAGVAIQFLEIYESSKYTSLIAVKVYSNRFKIPVGSLATIVNENDDYVIKAFVEGKIIELRYQLFAIQTIGWTQLYWARIS